jgi:hypothetical protein
MELDMSLYKMRFYIAFFPLATAIGYFVYQWPEIKKENNRQMSELENYMPTLLEVPTTLSISDARYAELKENCETRNSRTVLEKHLNDICTCFAYNMVHAPTGEEISKKKDPSEDLPLDPDVIELYQTEYFQKKCLEKYNY